MLKYAHNGINVFSLGFSYDKDLTGERSDKYFRLPAKNDAMAKEHFRSRLQQERGSGKLPIYPNGWFGILESSEIGRNEVKNVTALGKFSIKYF